MKKRMICFSFASTLFIIGDDAVKKKDKKKEELKNEGPKLKVEDVTSDGKIIKSGDDFVLMKNRMGVTLPKPNEKDSKVKLEDWVGKTVIVSGKGSILKYEKEGKQLERITFESIESIKLPEPKEGEKKEEKKPEEMK